MNFNDKPDNHELQVISVIWSLWVEEISVDFMYQHIAVPATDPIITSADARNKQTAESVAGRDRVISKGTETDNDAAPPFFFH